MRLPEVNKCSRQFSGGWLTELSASLLAGVQDKGLLRKGQNETSVTPNAPQGSSLSCLDNPHQHETAQYARVSEMTKL